LELTRGDGSIFSDGGWLPSLFGRASCGLVLVRSVCRRVAPFLFRGLLLVCSCSFTLDWAGVVVSSSDVFASSAIGLRQDASSGVFPFLDKSVLLSHLAWFVVLLSSSQKLIVRPIAIEALRAEQRG
jgi:hypothetical protein